MKKFHLLALAVGLSSSLCALPLTTHAAVDDPEEGDVDGSGFDDDLEVGEEDGDNVNYYHSYWFRDYYDSGDSIIYHFDIGYIYQYITPGEGFYYYDYKTRSTRFTDDSYATYDEESDNPDEADGLRVKTRKYGWIWIDYQRSTPRKRVIYVYKTREYRTE